MNIAIQVLSKSCVYYDQDYVSLRMLLNQPSLLCHVCSWSRLLKHVKYVFLLPFSFHFSEIICGDPGDIEHGTKRLDGFDVKYSCDRGFTMQGNSTLTCSRGGLWDNKKPNCTCVRTNEKAYARCARACDPNKNTCRGNKKCLCDGDCGYSCLTEGKCDCKYSPPPPLPAPVRFISFS